ncbi:SGNH/GDSL hydrolase family protein [Bacillus sp. FJAT-49736]|uniref:SGNH/GDSL hydrolase family protein n=1 Tax=Bacillus sp. FJAT-49736 TaxID=2833582 RepID=UPI001BC9DA93|nr:SGNH/GDSL hydrolase family protein [Bacillus sp. FJAT-49736]MBS4171688.1 SGNH/GDSL hydrolase family protein [Bacillus sp. FJAT-49736]
MKKSAINIITIVSVISALLFLFGFGWVLNDQLIGSQGKVSVQKQVNTEDNLAKSTKQLQIAALGDSLTRGTGDPEGKGYIGYLTDELKQKTKKSILLSNSAIKGQTSSQLISQLKGAEIQRQLRDADIILLTIGGNDLFQGGEAITNLNATYMKKAEKPYLKNLNQIYKTIRSINKDATIFHVGLYNPFIDMEKSKFTSSIVRKWNFDSANLAANYKAVIYVPTFDLFELHVNDYLFSDKFHPNAAGYKLIGERVASLITFSEGEKK